MIVKDHIILFGAGMSTAVYGAMAFVQKTVSYIEPTTADCIIMIAVGLIFSIYQLKKTVNYPGFKNL